KLAHRRAPAHELLSANERLAHHVRRHTPRDEVEYGGVQHWHCPRRTQITVRSGSEGGDRQLLAPFGCHEDQARTAWRLAHAPQTLDLTRRVGRSRRHDHDLRLTTLHRFGRFGRRRVAVPAPDRCERSTELLAARAWRID